MQGGLLQYISSTLCSHCVCVWTSCNTFFCKLGMFIITKLCGFAVYLSILIIHCLDVETEEQNVWLAFITWQMTLWCVTARATLEMRKKIIGVSVWGHQRRKSHLVIYYRNCPCIYQLARWLCLSYLNYPILGINSVCLVLSCRARSIISHFSNI